MMRIAALNAKSPAAPSRAAGQVRYKWDPVILLSVFLLMALGALMVQSASISIAARTTGNPDYYFLRHLVHMGIGLLAMYAVMLTPVRYWERTGPWLLFLGIVLLIVVLVPGVGLRVNGSVRWIRLGAFNLQPSELMKLLMVVYVAGYLVRRQDRLRRFVPGILMIGLVVAVAGTLILQQPDLGAVVVMCATVLGMAFLAGVRFWHFLVVLAAGVGGMAALTWISPYRLERIVGFLDPWADPFDSGFQLVQALIAFGRGETLGVGLGASVQKLFYLPAAHTDFLLAVLAEELGFIGVLAVILTFGVLIVRGLRIGLQAQAAGQRYAARLAQGISLLLGMQAMVNMGVNMGLLPTKGLTLPLMSYGGSSMVVSAVAVGLLLRIEREARLEAWRRR